MSLRPGLYLETSIVSYLTSRPSRDLRVAAHQEITKEWWERRRGWFDLFVSQLVADEAARGDREAAERRLEALTRIPRVAMSERAFGLAEFLVHKLAVPKAALGDAMHIATATVHGAEYLLTWNCKHIANAVLRDRIGELGLLWGFQVPVICTPEELLED
jgi:predicted nucleic acid-binding protein